MDGERFDGLTKALARGLGRRGLLRALGGGAAALAVGQRSVAAQGDVCAQTCRDVFPPGPERGACISAGAQAEAYGSVNCGGCGIVCAAGGSCQGEGCVYPAYLCAAQGVDSPSTCDAYRECPPIPVGGGPNLLGCSAYPATSGACVCSSGSGFTTNWPCEWGCPDYPHCVQTGRGFGQCQESQDDFPVSGLPCQTDGDCARYGTCHADGYCGGEACQADDDCNGRLGGGHGPGWACIRDDTGCLSGYTGNFCSPRCPYQA